MKFLFAAAFVAALACASAQTASVTLLNTIRNSPDHEVFSRLLPASSPALDERYGSVDKISTVYAPTDAAFAALIVALGFPAPTSTDESINVLTSFRSQLDAIAAVSPDVPSFSDILYYHMSFGRIGLFKGKRGQSLKTGLTNFDLQYSEADELVDGDLTSNTPITTKNIRHINGFLNIIPEVLLPLPAANIQAVIGAGVPVSTPSMSPMPDSTSAALPSISAVASSVAPPVVPPVVPPPTGSSPAASASATPSPAESSSVGASPVESSSVGASPVESSVGASPVESSAAASTPGTGAGTGEGDETPEPSASDDDDDDDGGVCFPAAAKVHLADGSMVRMDQLEAGQDVHHNTAKESSKVFLFTHRTSAKRARFVRLSTSCGQVVTLTASHYLREASGALVAAGDVKVGHTEVNTVGGVCKISKSEMVAGVGLYAPHTVHGDLVVDGVVVSGYSKAIHPGVAHALLLPVRWFVKTFSVKEPLGKTFYNGADWVLKVMPRGQATVTSV